MARHDDDDHLGMLLPNPPNYGEDAAVWECCIEKNEINVVSVEPRQDLSAIVDESDDFVLGCQGDPERLSDGPMVVYDEEAHEQVSGMR
jgi:hypothetical protein